MNIKAILVTMRSVRLTHVERLGQALGGFATFAAAALAFWAYFFSSLPEEMTRQFNSQIARLNEETKDLMRERSALNEDVAASKEALAQASARELQERQDALQELGDLNGQIADLKKQKNAREQELALLTTQLKQAASQKQKYATFVASNQIGLASYRIFDELEQLSNDPELASTISKFRSWADQEKTIGPKPNPPTKEYYDKAYKYYDAIPKEWMTQKFLRGSSTNGLGSSADILLEFIKKISDSSFARMRTGRDLMNENVTQDIFKEMAPADSKNAMAYITSSMERNKRLLLAPLVVVVSPDATDAEIEQKGREVLQNIKQFRDYFADLANNVSLAGR